MIKYRSDIDGLRTIAVGIVVAYHSGVPFISGGFVGVDMFFVISGFLITGVITSNIETERFTFLDFGIRRIKRLLPPLVPVLILAMSIAYFRLLPEDFGLFSDSLIGTVTFTSNFVFLSQTDYFVEAADIKPLLHTWSLAVEEQFYLVAPAFFFFAFKFVRKPTVLMISIALAVISLIGAEYFLRIGEAAQAFYNPLLRAWELLAGSTLSLAAVRLPKGWISIVARIVGLLLIGYCSFANSSDTVFPGLAAMPCIVGTCLLLTASSDGKDPVRSVLQFAPVAYIGRLSYAIYLWHWPLLVLARLTAPNDIVSISAAVASSVVFSALSYHFLEKPLRFGGTLKAPVRAFSFLGAFSALGIVFGLFSGELHTRRFENSRGLNLSQYFERNTIHAAWTVPECTARLAGFENLKSICLEIENPDAATLLLMGDSHAQHLYPGMKERWPDTNILTIMDGGCKLILDQKNKSPDCDELRDATFESDIWEDVDSVVLALRWNREFFDNTIKTTKWLHDRGIKVWLVGPMPEFSPGINELYAANSDKTLRELAEIANANLKTWPFELHTELMERVGSVDYINFIDPIEIRCESDINCLLFTPNGEPLTFDESHLSIPGSTWFVTKMPDIFHAD